MPTSPLPKGNKGGEGAGIGGVTMQRRGVGGASPSRGVKVGGEHLETNFLSFSIHQTRKLLKVEDFQGVVLTGPLEMTKGE